MIGTRKRIGPIGVLVLACLALGGCPPTVVRNIDPDGPVRLMPTAELRDQILSTNCDTQPFRDLADLLVQGDRNGVVVSSSSKRYSIRPLPDEARFLVSTTELNDNQRHDCQRLIFPNDTPGTPMMERPLVGVFPSSELLKAGPFQDGVVVADIINYDAIDYAPLGIPPGLSCLWIQSNPDGDQWKAAIRPPVEDRCNEAQYEDRPDSELKVSRRSVHSVPDEYEDADFSDPDLIDLIPDFPDATAEDYPHVARWMWDSVSETQFIGIQCGNGWCEIGNPEFEPSPAGLKIVSELPGWSDEQFLSVPDHDGRPVLSSLWGRIEPGEDNEYVEETHPGNWQCTEGEERHVATMEFLVGETDESRDAWRIYANKYSLNQKTADAQHHILYRVHPVIQNDTCSATYQLRSTSSPWTTVTRCKLTHSGSGTVRWAWTDDDDGVWVPCDAGCCMARGFGGS